MGKKKGNSLARRKLSLRQSKYKANRLKGMSQYNAAVAAGYAETTARKACKIEYNERVNASMCDHFERAGLTNKAIAEKVTALTEAEKTIGIDGHEVRTEDNAARLKALELAGKFTGKLNNKLEVDGKVGHHGEFLAALIVRAGA